MFSLLAILGIVLAVGVVPAIATLLFAKRAAMTVNPEESCWRSRSKWRPGHPGAHVIKHRTPNCDDVSTFDAAARRL
jgi:hypothetical protein